MTTKTARIMGLYAGERRNCQIVNLTCVSLGEGDEADPE
jgi:hypothetical protein